MAYARRHVGGFVDKPTLTTPIDSTFLNAVEAALLKLYALDPADGQVMAWVAANSRFEPTLLKNAHIDPAAAIAKSKLAALSITDADVAGGAAIAQSKLALALVQPTNFAPGSKITTSPLAGGPPASPSDGDIWIATGVDANGTRWQFQYNAGSASAYKWEFSGGNPYSGSLSTLSTSSTTYTTISGSSFTLPRSGEYRVTFGALLYQNGTFGGPYSAYIQPFLAGAAFGYDARTTFTQSGMWSSVSSYGFTATTAGQVMDLRGRADSPQPTGITNGWFFVLPARIS